MIELSRPAGRLRSLGLVLLLCAMASVSTAQPLPPEVVAAPAPDTEVVAAPAPAAESEAAPAPADSNPATNGELLVHGNYCGLGSREGSPPIDLLDAACMRHDRCTPAGGIPDCACNARLREEAAAVAASPDQPPELKVIASATASAAAVMVCSPIGAISPAPALSPAPR